MKNIIKIVLAIVIVTGLQSVKVSAQKFSTAGFFEVEDGARKVYNFNRGWRFYKGDVVGARITSYNVCYTKLLRITIARTILIIFFIFLLLNLILLVSY